MSEMQLISLIGALGVIAYLAIGYRSFRETGRKTMLLAAIWIAIFGVVVLAVSWWLP